jgi:hypothetical protein
MLVLKKKEKRQKPNDVGLLESFGHLLFVFGIRHLNCCVDESSLVVVCQNKIKVSFEKKRKKKNLSPNELNNSKVIRVRDMALAVVVDCRWPSIQRRRCLSK